FLQAEDGIRDATVTRVQTCALPISPSLAILDWTMPGMDGLELCRRVRGLPKPIKPYLIFVTARARTQDIVTGLTAGADDYIVKRSGERRGGQRAQTLGDGAGLTRSG